jgi:hypothetical protein
VKFWVWLVDFFLVWWRGLFVEVSRKIWLQNVVFWMVKRGGVVVFCVAGSALILATKKVPRF